MRALPSDLRRQLEARVLDARRTAESASRAALDGLGVFSRDRPGHLDADQAALRNGLRAKLRQLGDDRGLLITECAYEQWHRLLFARFLAENNLLLHPQFKVPVSLSDCDDLATDLGEPDGWSVAARFASEILPGIFRLDDPCFRLRLAPEGRYALEQILAELAAEVFIADDSLGWVYQFWQKDKKDEINDSERKIGGADLGPVTQLFTENYMVRFLLENSLGAWWTASYPDSALVTGFEYLRYNDERQPAAGCFDGWPTRVAELTVMDPCCGSGHFLVEAFSMLWKMRAEEEDLSAVEAQDAVLRDNIFGLEIDPRCVQIAMFAVALAAWKAGTGWRELPVPHIACTGVPAKDPLTDWTALADGDFAVSAALERLHDLFEKADTFGSLIDPRAEVEAWTGNSGQISLVDATWDDLLPSLLSAKVGNQIDPRLEVLRSAAQTDRLAFKLLSKSYTLIATNVPFLSRAKQSSDLRSFIERWHYPARGDLATSFISRWITAASTFCAVTPQNWQEIPVYKEFRTAILRERTLNMYARLGNNVWQNQAGKQPFKVSTLLSIMSSLRPLQSSDIAAIDIGNGPISEKSHALKTRDISFLLQAANLENPDARITIAPGSLEKHTLLEDFADCYQGTSTGDSVRYCQQFWELPTVEFPWSYWQSTVQQIEPFGGRQQIVKWSSPDGVEINGAAIRGRAAWGKQGVMVSQMGRLYVSLYEGDLFDTNASPIIPKNAGDLSAIWKFCSSPDYYEAVRRIDNSVKVSNRTLAKVPFDLSYWQREAAEGFGIPERRSTDPVQWLYAGKIETCPHPLHVAVARLLNYHWPEQDKDGLDDFADNDGIVCLPPVAGELSAASRLETVLAHAYGAHLGPTTVTRFLREAGSKKGGLVEWLRDDLFRQHCTLFLNRPFIWHIWDGLHDGFAALVNYHRLDRKLLEKLTYTYLGQDWVERQRAAVRDEVTGADERLAAALDLHRKLEAILEGEKPYDIYVRWKKLDEQPIGWEPDLNDGVRLNVRPFVKAGILRSEPHIRWNKDRGKNPDRSDRNNDNHFLLAEKREARKRAGKA